MALTKDEILELIQKAKELGLQNIEVDGFKASFSPITPTKPTAPSEPNVELKAEDIVTPESAFNSLSDEEIQYWSSPYYEEIQAKKELQAKSKELANE